MSAFTCVVETEKKDGFYIVSKPFRFYLNDNLIGEYVEVPCGTVTNFATVPKYLRWLVNPNDPKLRASSILHDAMVGEFGKSQNIKLAGHDIREPSWKESAAWYREALRVSGCSRSKRQLVYLAVKAHGILKG